MMPKDTEISSNLIERRVVRLGRRTARMTLALHEEKRGTTALNACKGRKGEIRETEEACSGRDILLYTGVLVTVRLPCRNGYVIQNKLRLLRLIVLLVCWRRR